ncbi:hypothetical protein D0469_15260 [Peribacillus saganii]|uniref:Uncharacterized protein n=1 Tax=Peribacillus saganii TaxID=2303992 RepID=A0A372LKI6_9BACI|nr:hypothetical protein [Peribacillus saganii]RFU67257.1 hypothetical protein D0469_15260 [Peribacillus saganii]
MNEFLKVLALLNLPLDFRSRYSLFPQNAKLASPNIQPHEKMRMHFRGVSHIPLQYRKAKAPLHKKRPVRRGFILSCKKSCWALQLDINKVPILTMSFIIAKIKKQKALPAINCKARL